MFRYILFFILAIVFNSCDYLLKFKENNPQQKLDTIIDFKKVDVPPLFEGCVEFIEGDDLSIHEIKEEKEECFRNSIREKIEGLLQNFSDTTAIAIDEVVELNLRIDKEGSISIEKIKIPKIIKAEMPNLGSYLENSIADFPELSPALKRGIPVVVQYKLPIHIRTK